MHLIDFLENVKINLKGHLKRPHSTCHRPPATDHIPPATDHLPPATDHLPPTTCHLPPTTCHRPHATCHRPHATCHLPPATDHMPPATDHMPPTTCHLPPATTPPCNTESTLASRAEATVKEQALTQDVAFIMTGKWVRNSTGDSKSRRNGAPQETIAQDRGTGNSASEGATVDKEDPQPEVKALRVARCNSRPAPDTDLQTSPRHRPPDQPQTPTSRPAPDTDLQTSRKGQYWNQHSS
ncbi:uncharacterized protein [Procambarus clarkii]|uniref:uncharacterized protein n=1 Tax=Procambarus clarkii TaxID=6728 RepID=UPI00374383FB